MTRRVQGNRPMAMVQVHSPATSISRHCWDREIRTVHAQAGSPPVTLRHSALGHFPLHLKDTNSCFARQTIPICPLTCLPGWQARLVVQPKWLTGWQARLVVQPKWLTGWQVRLVVQPKWLAGWQVRLVVQPKWLAGWQVRLVVQPKWLTGWQVRLVVQPKWLAGLQACLVVQQELLCACTYILKQGRLN